MAEQDLCIIIEAEHAAFARALAAFAVPGAGPGMFSTPLRPRGGGDTTHYVSSGFVDESIIPLLTDPGALYAAAQEAIAEGVDPPDGGLTTGFCEALVDGVDISTEGPFAAFDRLNLEIAAVDE